jgi:hypothetical protein
MLFSQTHTFNMSVPPLLQYFQYTLIEGNVFSYYSNKTGEFGLSYTRQVCAQIAFHSASKRSDFFSAAESRAAWRFVSSNGNAQTAALLTLPTVESGVDPLVAAPGYVSLLIQRLW